MWYKVVCFGKRLVASLDSTAVAPTAVVVTSAVHVCTLYLRLYCSLQVRYSYTVQGLQVGNPEPAAPHGPHLTQAHSSFESSRLSSILRACRSNLASVVIDGMRRLAFEPRSGGLSRE